jgi:hypothetical protein
MWFNSYNIQTHKLIHGDKINYNRIATPKNYELDVIVVAPNLLLGDISIFQKIGTSNNPKYVKMNIALPVEQDVTQLLETSNQY